MRRDGTIVSYTAEELAQMIRRGEDRTDWARVLAMTDEEIEANADADEDSQGEWIPVPDALAIAFPHTVIRLDFDVVDWFMAQGRDYVRRMNDVLRACIKAQTVVATATD
jgi:uncharacterized protein (DUF4415 family)